MSSLKDNEYLKELETSFITNILNNETKILEMNSGILKINKLVVKLENKFKELFSKMKEYDLKKEKLKSNIRQNNINASRILNTWISVDEKFSLDNSKLFKDSMCGICHSVGTIPVIPKFDCKCNYEKFTVCLRCVRTHCKLDLNNINEYKEIKCFLCRERKHFIKKDDDCFLIDKIKMQRTDNILKYMNYKLINCDKCNQQFFTLSNYYKHIINNCKEEIIKCSNCHKYRLKKDICNCRIDI
jgi:hypothetical protein